MSSPESSDALLRRGTSLAFNPDDFRLHPDRDIAYIPGDPTHYLRWMPLCNTPDLVEAHSTLNREGEPSVQFADLLATVRTHFDALQLCGVNLPLDDPPVQFIANAPGDSDPTLYTQVRVIEHRSPLNAQTLTEEDAFAIAVPLLRYTVWAHTPQNRSRLIFSDGVDPTQWVRESNTNALYNLDVAPHFAKRGGREWVEVIGDVHERVQQCAELASTDQQRRMARHMLQYTETLLH